MSIHTKLEQFANASHLYVSEGELTVNKPEGDVEFWDCTDLEEVNAPQAKKVIVSYCKALRQMKVHPEARITDGSETFR